MDEAEWLKKNPALQRFEKKHPKISAFFGRRFSRRGRYGLKFTWGMVLCASFLVIFIEMAIDVLSRESVPFDLSVMNFIYTFRNLDFARVFLFFTDLGDWQIMTALIVILIIFFLMLGKKQEALFSVATLAVGEALYSFVKILMAVPRPSVFYSLVPRSGFSFPSGHAVGSVVFYGMAGYLIAKMFRRHTPRMIVWATTALIVLGIGLSRIYLGVHWISDVLAGWSLGLAIVFFSITLFKEFNRDKPAGEKPVFKKRSIYQITAAFLAGGALFIYYFYLYHPLEYKVQPNPPAPIFLSATTTITDLISRSDFPKFSEAITGDKMEPMSFVVVGSRDALVSAFKKEGWLIADAPTTANFVKLGLAALAGKAYDTAPASPSFLNAKPQLITFEKNVGNTFKVRHHTRFWLTNFYYGTEPVWVASASFDEGLQRYLIYHKISPDIDTERNYINADLLHSGFVATGTAVQLVPPQMGENFAGDPFFTDGKAYVIFLR